MAEDFNKLKMISRRMVHAPFKKPWDFRILVDDAPADFDLLVKGISYGPTTIETEQIKAGSITITVPTGTQPTEISLTMRDMADGRFRKWFQARSSKVVNGIIDANGAPTGFGGTFNTPYGKGGYLMRMSRVSLTDPNDVEGWLMFPTKLGELSLEVDGEGFTEFPATFIQFNSGT